MSENNSTNGAPSMEVAKTLEMLEFELNTFRKEQIVQKGRDNQDRISTKRNPRSHLELYSEVQYAFKSLRSSDKLCLVFKGLANIKYGLDFVQSLQKAGVSIQTGKFVYVEREFEDLKTVMVPEFRIVISELVPLDNLVRLSNGFKARFDVSD